MDEMNTFCELDLDFYLKKFQEDRIPLVPVSQERSVEEEKRNIEAYLSRLDGGKIAEYKKMNDALPPMKESCRIVVLIPSRFESKRIVTCLEALTNQDLSQYKDLYQDMEILVLDNYHYDETPDDTKEVVDQYCQKFNKGEKPPIYYVRKQFAKEDKRYGLCRARKTLTDFMLYRAMQRGGYPKPLYIASGDADLTFLDPDTFSSVIDTFDKHAHIDAVRGIQDRETRILSQNAYLFLERRSWNFTEIMYSHTKYRPEFYPYSNFTWNRVVTGGWHTYFTANAYALINGYTDTIRFLEDIDIGNRISVLRGNLNQESRKFDYKTLSIVPTHLRADSSPSRFVMALANKADPYSRERDYDCFFSEESESFVREFHMSKSLDAINRYRDVTEENKSDFQEILKRVCLNSMEVMTQKEEALKIIHRVMILLGFTHNDYHVSSEGGMTVKSYDNFTRYLNLYRKGRKG
ncbi:MAG: glycosyltransferase [Hungatella sp.]|jgi:glycosyltransferase involved in cell wall biosynthesis|nr:glycosyltransferase [Hungatella sp.]